MQNNEQNIFIKKKRLFFVIIILGFLSLGFIANKWKWELSIERIRIEGNVLQSNESIIQSSGLKIGSSMYDYDLKDIEVRIKKNSYVRAVMVNRNLPAEISVQIWEREPIGIIISDKVYYIDSEKKLFSYNMYKEMLDLPVISGLNYELNQMNVSNDKRLDSVITILNLMKNKCGNLLNLISEIDMNSGNGLILYSTSGCIPIILNDGDLEEKVRNLNAFINTYLDDIKKVEYINLSYRDQVVVRWK